MKGIRSLVLAGIAALALSITGASTASAAQFVSEAPFTHLAGGSASQQLDFPASPVYECGGPTFSGTTEGKETEIGYASESLASSSVSTNCANGPTVKWKSCQLILHPPASGAEGAGTVDIGPVGCGPISVYTLSLQCEWTIPAQSGIPATYYNVGAGTGRKVSVSLGTNTLQYSVVTAAGCGTQGAHSDGAWVASFTVSGENGGGSPVGLRAAKVPVNLFTSGTSFGASKYPAAITAEVSKEHRFTPNPGGISLQCQAGSFASGLSAASASLKVGGSYTQCASFLGAALTVKMNSCGYVLAIGGAGPPAVGTVQVSCANPGDAIEFEAGSICKYRIPAQTLGNATYGTSGQKLQVEVTGSGITIERTLNKFVCPSGGTSGAFSGGFSFGGVEA